MNDELWFRAAVAVGILSVAVMGAYFRIRNRPRGETIDRMQEGLVMLIGLRLLGLLGVASLVVYVARPEWMTWSQLALPPLLRWMGVPAGVCGWLLMLWMFRHLGMNITDTVVTRAEHTLVTTGPYRWIRHPLYSAMLLLVAGASLLSANWLVPLIGVAAFVLLVIRTRKEEANLVARFGDAYRDYMARTGRFMPHWRKASRDGD
ncbi:MAG: isoprenylcysteine carboxylmethyltransferase family protein [Pirellulaceae bacterium]